MSNLLNKSLEMNHTIHKMNYTVEKPPRKPFNKCTKPNYATGVAACFMVCSRIPYNYTSTKKHVNTEVLELKLYMLTLPIFVEVYPFLTPFPDLTLLIENLPNFQKFYFASLG